MFGALLQDWLTIEGTTTGGSSPIAQTEAFWLDTSDFLDLTTFLQVVSASNVTLQYQTSPTKDETLFESMDSVTLATGVTVGVYLRDTASYPLSHWLRWQLTGTSSTWNATFRVWVTLNRPGGYARMSEMAGDGAGSGGPSWVYARSGGGGAAPVQPSLSKRFGSALNTRTSLQAPSQSSTPTNAAIMVQSRPIDEAPYPSRFVFGGPHRPNLNIFVPRPTQQGDKIQPFLPPGTKVEK